MDNNKITKWFSDNFHIRPDWTGTYVETNEQYESVEEMINKFFKDVGEDGKLDDNIFK